MDGVHDLGGLQGFGPVRPEPNEPLFHADWEKRALAVPLAMGASGQWNLDLSRAARESLPPAQYLGSSYYGIWISALEKLLLERGLVSEAELAGRTPSQPGPSLRVLQGPQVDGALARGASTQRPAASPARFATGQRVRARNLHPAGHTRLVDVYRSLHPDTTDECYTWWSNRGQARAKNVGWRIDYHLATPGLAATARQASVFKDQWFSDHAPLTVDYDFSL